MEELHELLCTGVVQKRYQALSTSHDSKRETARDSNGFLAKRTSSRQKSILQTDGTSRRDRQQGEYSHHDAGGKRDRDARSSPRPLPACRGGMEERARQVGRGIPGPCLCTLRGADCRSREEDPSNTCLRKRCARQPQQKTGRISVCRPACKTDKHMESRGTEHRHLCTRHLRYRFQEMGGTIQAQ